MTASRRALAIFASAAAAAMLLTACSSSTEEPAASEDPSAAASEEARSLVVYSGRDEELIAPLIEQFEEASGITVDVRYAGSTELAAQLLEEGEATPAEVFLSQDSGSLGAVAADGLLTELPADVLDLVPAEYAANDDTWVGLTGRARVIAYDSEKYTEDQVPGDIWELLEPEWQGKVGIVPSNASFQAFITALRLAEGEDRALEWLEGIKANGAQILGRNGELLEAVNAGTVDLGLINHYYWARSEQDPTTLRAQLKFGDPGSVGALVNVTGAGILQGAADSSAALEFVEYLVSDAGQTYFVEETYEYPLVDGIDGPAGVPPLEDLRGPDVDLSKFDSLDQTVALITEAGLL